MKNRTMSPCAWWVLAAVVAAGAGVGALADEPGAAAAPANAEVLKRTAAVESGESAVAASADASASAGAAAGAAPGEAKPARDPTLIAVPSNTLGPGLPLWARREHEDAAARIARAAAEEAEARAALARVEAQRAADEAYRFADTAGGVVVYGPRRPGLERAIRDRPIPARHVRAGPWVTSTPVDDDPFDAAQREFAETARPRIGPAIEAQLEAQRRFGENAYPGRVIEIQRGIDKAVIRARRGAPKPREAGN